MLPADATPNATGRCDAQMMQRTDATRGTEGCPGPLDPDRDLCTNRDMPEVKVTPFRFTDEELEVLGIIEGHTGILSRTEALRQVLHEHERAQGDGVDVDEPTESKTQP